ncbi:unnamed protein product, partial [Prorocentrum cordatum]
TPAPAMPHDAVGSAIFGGLLGLSPDASLCARWRASDAGWGVCLDELRDGCIVYTAGPGSGESFARELSAHGCAVHALDAKGDRPHPTPAST